MNIDKELKDSDYRFEDFKIKINKKELDDYISGSPHRTKDLFKKMGVNLDSDSIFNLHKDLVNTIVVKRNKIVHHNDDASDVTNDDLKKNIETIKEYIENLDKIICSQV